MKFPFYIPVYVHKFGSGAPFLAGMSGDKAASFIFYKLSDIERFLLKNSKTLDGTVAQAYILAIYDENRWGLISFSFTDGLGQFVLDYP